MNMKSMIKAVLVLLGFTLAGSCNEYWGINVDCSDCYYEKPDSESLVIYLTINEEHPEVPLVVYRGYVEDKQVDWVDTARESPYKLYSALNQYYSVAAEYRVNGRKVIAVDGDEMKAKHVSDDCDYECWIVAGGYLKAELKFD